MRGIASLAATFHIVALSAVLQPSSGLAEAKIGIASATKNQVHGIVGGGSRIVSTGSELFSNETVRTGEASLAQLLVNDTTCLGLVEIKCLSLVLCLFDDGCTLLGGCLHHLGLEFGQALLKLLPLVFELLFGFSGQC